MVNLKVGDFVVASFGDWKGVWEAVYRTMNGIVFMTFSPSQQGSVDLVKMEDQIIIEQVLESREEAWRVIRNATE